MAADRKTGTVKSYDKTNGFGFITQADGGQDLLFHCSEMKTNRYLNNRYIGVGESVEYVVGSDSSGGIVALDVTDVVDDLKKGTVKWFDAKKDYGLIIQDDGDIKGRCDLVKGEIVEYVVKPSSDGRVKAADVTGPNGADVLGGGGGGGGESPVRDDIKCFKCSEFGHKARNCINPGKNSGADFKVRTFGCYKCGEDTHVASDCEKTINSQIHKLI